MAFTVREGVLDECTALEDDGTNKHIRGTVRCTDGPPDIYHVVILNDAAERVLSLREQGGNPKLVIAGHLHAWHDAQDQPQVEIALTHLGLSLANDFIYVGEDH